jgi:hypothetical protein
MEVKVSTDVQTALEKFGAKPITPAQLAEHINFTERDLHFLRIFEPSVFNKSWILLDRDLAKEWFCKNDTSKDAVRNFYNRILLKHFIDGIDYKKADENDPEVVNFCSSNLTNKTERRGGSNRQFYWITGECLKSLGMMQNREIRDYYIRVEKLMYLMLEYSTQIRVIAAETRASEQTARANSLEAEVASGEQANMIVKQVAESQRQMVVTGHIYTATTKTDLKMNRFKLGLTKDLGKRLDKYNKTFTNENSRVFFCDFWPVHDMRLVEQMCKLILKPFHLHDPTRTIQDESFIINYEVMHAIVSKICTDHMAVIGTANNALSHYAEVVRRPSTVVPKQPPQQPLMLTMKIEGDGKVSEVSFDISTMSPTDRDARCRDIINQFIRNNTDHKSYNISSDHKDAADLKTKIEVKWKDLEKFIRNMAGRGQKTKVPTDEWKPEITKLLVESKSIKDVGRK